MPKERAKKKDVVKRGPRAPYQITCSNCRQRKVKCDGGQPQCRICLAYEETCRYDKPPPMSQIVAMAQRITELESALKQAYETSESQNGSVAGDSISAPVQTSNPRPSEKSWMSDEKPSIPEKTYYQSTSALEGPTRPDEDDALPVSPSLPSMDASQLAFWEQMASQLSAVHLQLPLEMVTHLLTTNWTWFHPLFMFIPRPLFVRDAAVGGRYFTPLLLAALCLHSTRLTSHALSENLLAQARLLLGPELHREWSVTTIQALLLLSAREVGRGAMSQTWLYSGMAFRMAVDQGIFSRQKTIVHDPEMLAVKDQLAWSCYLWDKTISLYLGRTPSLPEPPSFDPPPIDDLLENEIWSPYTGAPTETLLYVEMPSHTSSCFANFCRLATIITDILMTIYAKRIPADPLPFVQQTRKRLEEWRSNSPSHLKVDPNSPTPYHPPPHIFSQNILYFATLILLHRPLRGAPHSPSRSICRQAARSVSTLVLRMESSFGMTHISYIVAYCVYTAATVAVLDLHDGVEGSPGLIETFLRALKSVRTSCPGVGGSIALIKKSIEGRMPRESKEFEPFAFERGKGMEMQPGPLPAFPLEPCGDFCQVGSATAGGGVFPMEMPPFGGMDPYALDWTELSNDWFGDFPI